MCDYEDKMQELNEEYESKREEIEDEERQKKVMNAIGKLGLTCIGIGFFSGSAVSSAFYLWPMYVWPRK